MNIEQFEAEYKRTVDAERKATEHFNKCAAKCMEGTTEIEHLIAATDKRHTCLEALIDVKERRQRMIDELGIVITHYETDIRATEDTLQTLESSLAKKQAAFNRLLVLHVERK